MSADTPRFSQLDQWLLWMETLHPQAIDLGLERVKTVAERLNISKSRAQVITVAGTNGKGSCVACLEAVLSNSGKTVGAYTSPHLLTYNERIRIAGGEVSDEIISDAFAKIDKARESISLTYFEFGTLAALLIFLQQDLDFWLLEVGLGGRLDAVNIIEPDIAVITSIDLDHQAWLGETRDQIAIEKLGVLRADTPCICAETDLTPSMVERFAILNAPVLLRDKDFSYREHTDHIELSLKVIDHRDQTLRLPRIELPLPSLAAAFQVLSLCNELPEQALADDSMTKLRLSGRFQVVNRGQINYVLDVAHNPAACALLAEKLSKYTDKKVMALVGMMKDKQHLDALSKLVPKVEHWLVTEFADSERSAKCEEIVSTLRSLNVDEKHMTEYADVASALSSLTAKLQGVGSSQTAVAVVFGSFLTVSEALAYFAKH